MAEDFDWARNQGFTVVQAEELWHRSATPLIEQVRAALGDGPVYLTFDIDSLDPGFAPGTGTPEIGGLTPIQALELIRGRRAESGWGRSCRVSPPYDPQGNTALLAANLLYEMLCVCPGLPIATRSRAMAPAFFKKAEYDNRLARAGRNGGAQS